MVAPSMTVDGRDSADVIPQGDGEDTAVALPAAASKALATWVAELKPPAAWSPASLDAPADRLRELVRDLPELPDLTHTLQSPKYCSIAVLLCKGHVSGWYDAARKLFCPESKQVPFEDITIPGDTDCRVRQIEIARMADIERGKTQDGCIPGVVLLLDTGTDLIAFDGLHRLNVTAKTYLQGERPDVMGDIWPKETPVELMLAIGRMINQSTLRSSALDQQPSGMLVSVLQAMKQATGTLGFDAFLRLVHRSLPTGVPADQFDVLRCGRVLFCVYLTPGGVDALLKDLQPVEKADGTLQYKDKALTPSALMEWTSAPAPLLAIGDVATYLQHRNDKVHALSKVVHTAYQPYLDALLGEAAFSHATLTKLIKFLARLLTVIPCRLGRIATAAELKEVMACGLPPCNAGSLNGVSMLQTTSEHFSILNTARYAVNALLAKASAVPDRADGGDASADDEEEAGAAEAPHERRTTGKSKRTNRPEGGQRASQKKKKKKKPADAEDDADSEDAEDVAPPVDAGAECLMALTGAESAADSLLRVESENKALKKQLLISTALAVRLTQDGGTLSELLSATETQAFMQAMLPALLDEQPDNVLRQRAAQRWALLRSGGGAGASVQRG